MGLYRHTVTGRVREYDDRYAGAIKALEPVDDSGQDAVDSGADTADYVEPLTQDEGE